MTAALRMKMLRSTVRFARSVIEECYDGCRYNFYICSYCFAFGTDDPDCEKCGKEMCVLLYQEANAALALAKAKQ